MIYNTEDYATGNNRGKEQFFTLDTERMFVLYL